MNSKSMSMLLSVLILAVIVAIAPPVLAATSSVPSQTGSSAPPQTGSSNPSQIGSSAPPQTGSSDPSQISSTNATIPEFGSTTMLVLAITVIGIIAFTARTRILRL